VCALSFSFKGAFLPFGSRQTHVAPELDLGRSVAGLRSGIKGKWKRKQNKFFVGTNQLYFACGLHPTVLVAELVGKIHGNAKHFLHSIKLTATAHISPHSIKLTATAYLFQHSIKVTAMEFLKGIDYSKDRRSLGGLKVISN